MSARFYAAGIVSFVVLVCTLVFVGGGARIAPPAPTQHVAAPEINNPRICVNRVDDGTVQGACEWKESK